MTARNDFQLLATLYRGEIVNSAHVVEADRALDEVDTLRDRCVYLRNLLRDRGIEVRAS